MIAIPKPLKIVVELLLSLMAFIAAEYLVIAVYHCFFGTLGGNL